MDGHVTSIYRWMSVTSVNENTKRFIEFQTEKRNHNGVYPWEEHPFYFIISASGVNQVAQMGQPEVFGDTNRDYVHTNSFFIKNVPKGRQMMQDWIFGPSYEHGVSYASLYESLPIQSILNGLIFPENDKGAMVLLYKHLGKPDSYLIRVVPKPADQLKSIKSALLPLL
jgi:hypothetical protein